MKRKNKKLYRKRNTHWRTGQLDRYFNYDGSEYRYSRHTKKTKRDIQNEVQREKIGTKNWWRKGVIKREYYLDYTPLFMFLESQVGKRWDSVWKEALKRVDGNYKPILYIVRNVNKSGLVCEMPTEIDERGDTTRNNFTRAGEGSYYSDLMVDDDGILREVNPENTLNDFLKHDKYFDGKTESGWTNTLNGKFKLKRTSKQVKKSIKPDDRRKKPDYSGFDLDLKKKKEEEV